MSFLPKLSKNIWDNLAVTGSWWNRLQRQDEKKPEPKPTPMIDSIVDERKKAINSLTNWQRNQAGRACKGRWQRLNVSQLQKFAAMPHHKSKSLPV